MTFWEWMTTVVDEGYGRIDDLASDMKQDATWPIKSNDPDKLHDYLESMQACEDCIDTYEEAYNMYLQDVKHGLETYYPKED